MSAGKFETGRYETDSGTYIYECRVQPETKELALDTVANDYPAGTATAGLPTLDVRQNKRGYGVKARSVTVELTADGTGAQAEYKSGTKHTIPVFTKTVFDGYDKGQTGTYLGIACKFSRKSPETIV